MNRLVSRLVAIAVFGFAFSAAPVRGQLIVSTFFDSAVRQYDINTGALQATLVQPSGVFDFTGTLAGPSGMTIGPDNNLYISSQFSNSILKYNLQTNQLTTFIPSTTLLTLAGGNYAPSGLRFGTDGNLYVARSGGQSAGFGSGRVDRFNGTTGAPVGLPVATNLTQPSYITIQGNSLYVSDLGTGAVVKVDNYDMAVNSSGTPFTTYSPTFGPNYPAASTFGPGGNFYLADLGGQNPQGNVLKYNADGTNPSLYAHPNGNGDGNLLSQFPIDLLFKTDGKLLTANLGPTQGAPSGSVYLYDANGQYESTLISGLYSASAFALNPVPEPAWLLAAACGLFWIRQRGN